MICVNGMIKVYDIPYMIYRNLTACNKHRTNCELTINYFIVIFVQSICAVTIPEVFQIACRVLVDESICNLSFVAKQPRPTKTISIVETISYVIYYRSKLCAEDLGQCSMCCWLILELVRQRRIGTVFIEPNNSDCQFWGVLGFTEMTIHWIHLISTLRAKYMFFVYYVRLFLIINLWYLYFV